MFFSFILPICGCINVYQARQISYLLYSYPLSAKSAHFLGFPWHHYPQGHWLIVANIHLKRTVIIITKNKVFFSFLHWQHITGCLVMNRTYCLLQYFVLIIHRLCLLWAGPSASSRPSILSGTSFLFSISKFCTAWGLKLQLGVKLCKPGCPAASFQTSDIFTCDLSRDLARGLTGSEGLQTSIMTVRNPWSKIKQMS